MVCLVAKSDVRHVREALRTTLEENLAMVADTVAFLVGHGRRVFVDCEHFFDGYAADPDYGVAVLQAAFDAGAEVGVLCDTNGGMLPMGIGRVVADVRARVERPARHPLPGRHRLRGRQLPGRRRGRRHPRAGDGERLRRAGRQRRHLRADRQPGHQDGAARWCPRSACPSCSGSATRSPSWPTSPPTTTSPSSGASAFAHKAGLHASAIKVSPELYNHLDPAVVGNDMRILVTEMAGRASVELKGRELGVDLAGQADAIGRVVDRVKVLEADGWSFEAADASFELLLRGELPGAPAALFELESYRTIGRAPGQRRGGQRGDGEGALPDGDGGIERVVTAARATARSTRWTTRCGRRW